LKLYQNCFGFDLVLLQKKAETDAAFYSVTKEAQSLKEKLSEAFLRYTLFTSLANSTKVALIGDR
jgi:hypothetical protein